MALPDVRSEETPFEFPGGVGEIEELELLDRKLQKVENPVYFKKMVSYFLIFITSVDNLSFFSEVASSITGQ